MEVKIGLDAGHGLNTAGKQTPNGIKEWTLNDKVCDKVSEILSAYDTSIIRTDNNEGQVDESLAGRLQRYLNEGVAAFVSVHHNAYKSTWSDATGVEVWVDINATAEDLELAHLLYEKLVDYTKLKGRGIKYANFAVINQNKIPAVLVEGGFMDGTNDYKYITSEEGQKQYARAVAYALVEFLRLKKKKVSQPVSASKPTASTYIGGSIVDYLNSIGMPSDFNSRKKYATQYGISGYTGTAAQNTKLLKLMRDGAKTQQQAASKPQTSAYYLQYTGDSYGIDTVFRAIGVPEIYIGNYKNRKAIADANGMSGYRGTSSQNLKLISLAKQGKLKRP